MASRKRLLISKKCYHHDHRAGRKLMELEKRVDRVEDAILAIRDLLLRHDERLDDYFRALTGSREDFDFKLNALIDAQLKNEAEIGKLESASRSQLSRIEKLETR